MTVRTVEGEQGLIERALELDQRGDKAGKAAARAIRGVGVPMHNYLAAESPRWQTDADMVDSLTALTKTVGMVYATLLSGMAVEGKDMVMKDQFLKVLDRELTRNMAAMRDL